MTRVGRAKMEAHVGGSGLGSCCWGSGETRAGLVLVGLWATGPVLVGLMAVRLELVELRAGLVLVGLIGTSCW